jgi:hypothetical protein
VLSSDQPQAGRKPSGVFSNVKDYLLLKMIDARGDLFRALEAAQAIENEVSSQASIRRPMDFLIDKEDHNFVGRFILEHIARSGQAV